MARKPSSVVRGIKQVATERVFDEQAFVDGVFNDEFLLVIGSGVILDRSRFSDSGGDFPNIQTYIDRGYEILNNYELPLVEKQKYYLTTIE